MWSSWMPAATIHLRRMPVVHWCQRAILTVARAQTVLAVSRPWKLSCAPSSPLRLRRSQLPLTAVGKMGSILRTSSATSLSLASGSRMSLSARVSPCGRRQADDRCRGRTRRWKEISTLSHQRRAALRHPARLHRLPPQVADSRGHSSLVVVRTLLQRSPAVARAVSLSLAKRRRIAPHALPKPTKAAHACRHPVPNRCDNDQSSSTLLRNRTRTG